MSTGDITLFGKICPICEELSHYGKETEIVEMLDQEQYFFPEHTIKIKFCPECGRSLGGEHV